MQENGYVKSAKLFRKENNSRVINYESVGLEEESDIDGFYTRSRVDYE